MAIGFTGFFFLLTIHRVRFICFHCELDLVWSTGIGLEASSYWVLLGFSSISMRYLGKLPGFSSRSRFFLRFDYGAQTGLPSFYRVFVERLGRVLVLFCSLGKVDGKGRWTKKKGISWKKKKREKSGKKRQEKGGWAGDDDEGRPDTFAEQKTIATGRHRRKSRGRQVVRQPDCTEFFYRVFLFFFVFCRARSIIDS